MGCGGKGGWWQMPSGPELNRRKGHGPAQWKSCEGCEDCAPPECQGPCPADEPCDECEPYWYRMRAWGYWKDGEGWTDKAMREVWK